MTTLPLMKMKRGRGRPPGAKNKPRPLDAPIDRPLPSSGLDEKTEAEVALERTPHAPVTPDGQLDASAEVDEEDVARMGVANAEADAMNRRQRQIVDSKRKNLRVAWETSDVRQLFEMISAVHRSGVMIRVFRTLPSSLDFGSWKIEAFSSADAFVDHLLKHVHRAPSPEARYKVEFKGSTRYVGAGEITFPSTEGPGTPFAPAPQPSPLAWQAAPYIPPHVAPHAPQQQPIPVALAPAAPAAAYALPTAAPVAPPPPPPPEPRADPALAILQSMLADARELAAEARRENAQLQTRLFEVMLGQARAAAAPPAAAPAATALAAPAAPRTFLDSLKELGEAKRAFDGLGDLFGGGASGAGSAARDDEGPSAGTPITMMPVDSSKPDGLALALNRRGEVNWGITGISALMRAPQGVQRLIEAAIETQKKIDVAKVEHTQRAQVIDAHGRVVEQGPQQSAPTLPAPPPPAPVPRAVTAPKAAPPPPPAPAPAPAPTAPVDDDAVPGL
jgi:hypothetical protein